jgi:hypothetical protein
MSERLTATQRRHLEELKEIAARNRGEAFWYPVGAEWRSALSLSAKGLLHQEFSGGMGGAAFSITSKGLEATP